MNIFLNVQYTAWNNTSHNALHSTRPFKCDYNDMELISTIISTRIKMKSKKNYFIFEIITECHLLNKA